MRRLPLLILAIGSSACSSTTVLRSEVPIELSQPPGVKFTALKAEQNGGSMIVTGDIRSMRQARLKGHVDIEGLNRGDAIFSIPSKIRYFRPLQRTGYFHARIPIGGNRPDAVRLSYDPKRSHSGL